MIAFLVSAINICMVFLYGCIGETITEKSGHLNLGIPGIMCMGTLGGAFGVQIYMNSLSDPQNASFILLLLCALAMSMIVAAVGGLIYAFLTVTLRSNQNITGLALTTFGAGVTDFFMTTIDKSRFAVASKLIKTSLVDAIPALKNLGWFADIFLSHGILVYIAIALAIVVAWFMRKIRVGLNLRAIGESPATADAAGLNVSAYKYSAVLIGAAIAGIGGLFYVMDSSAGSWENSSTISAFGWLAIALVIFAIWRTDFAILGSFIFGLLYVFNSYSSLFGITTSLAGRELLKLLPYVVTLIVLIVTSIVGKKETQPPSSLGLNYFREDR